jgi:uncharacterized protein YdeI (BOF family)
MSKTNATHRSRIIGLLAAAVAMAGWALGTSAGAAENPNPYLKPNNTWIRISGTVKSVTADSFTLDYGGGLITVEMDDGDRDADAYKLIAGDKVTVNGKIDDDFFQKTTIEASSVYVEKLGTYFYASPADEEDVEFVAITTPVVLSSVTVRGTVTKVKDDEFVVDTGLRSLTVEVDEMPYNPLDDEGYQKIRVGDYVKVDGMVDYDLFEGRVLEADYVVKLSS